MSIFAGGLGLLAGDHLKAASDGAGWQQEAYEDNDFHTLPIKLLPNIRVQVELPHRTVAAQVWSVNVGRLRLLLLDTNIPTNSAEDRKITYQLYGGDLEMRLRQELVLGIGGYRALEAVGLEPTVYHMNEGHSAFLGLERVVRLMETQNLSFKKLAHWRRPA